MRRTKARHPPPASFPSLPFLIPLQTSALESARAALAEVRARAPDRGVGPGTATKSSSPSSFEFSSGRRDALGLGGGGAGTAAPATPPPPLEMQAQAVAAPATPVRDFADPPSTPDSLFLPSQLAADAARARATTELPPLQSVLDLTTAAAPPTRHGAAEAVAAPAATATAAPAIAAQILTDGKGTLADGTTYERDSGEERGPNGLWHRWTRLRGVSHGGKVEWQECWWETTDWAGRKEMGAEKTGCSLAGDAWREAWREAIGFDEATGEPTVERTAHKWATEAGSNAEWEEKWGEHYWASGKATKHADKWARSGPDVWHERWGEDYTGGGSDGCTKWTDKWAERERPPAEGGGWDKWGDKWEERFEGGVGGKKGETWSAGADGSSYNRWWAEDHLGGGWVRKHGHSTGGEAWDASERMDTYYNPIPHFTYAMAVDHSPTLRDLPVLPRGEGTGTGTGEDEEEDGLGEGVGAL